MSDTDLQIIVRADPSHKNSMRELEIILLRDWPVTIEKYDADSKTIVATRGDHRCQSCTD